MHLFVRISRLNLSDLTTGIWKSHVFFAKTLCKSLPGTSDATFLQQKICILLKSLGKWLKTSDMLPTGWLRPGNINVHHHSITYHCKTGHQLTNWPTNKAADQQTRQSINQPNNKPIKNPSLQATNICSNVHIGSSDPGPGRPTRPPGSSCQQHPRGAWTGVLLTDS